MPILRLNIMLSSFLGGSKAKESVSVKLTARNGVTFSGQIAKDATVAELWEALDPALGLPERQFFGLQLPSSTEVVLDPATTSTHACLDTLTVHIGAARRISGR
eukprot:TRINITY_DN11000_c0_g1_i7.p3 TRINITY_DN11000_c0_g1~~TRINITY_DN11000_c0_g1_i7.p3  ORF type:complete len:104 (+),score=2.26 TRINITY_DN11000_c0_g1_i7:280-591(+)